MKKIEKWEENYWNEEKINLYQYFSKTDLENLEALGIKISNKLYTEREYELINSKLMEFYKENKNSRPIPTKELLDASVSFTDYMHLLELFSKISNDYDI